MPWYCRQMTNLSMQKLAEYRTWLRTIHSLYLSQSTHGRRSPEQRRYRFPPSADLPLWCALLSQASCMECYIWYITVVWFEVPRYRLQFGFFSALWKLMGSFLLDRWRKKQMKWKRELKKTKKRHVLCFVIFCFVSLIYLYCSSHTCGYYAASHNLSVDAYVIHFLQFDLSRWVDMLMCWLPVQEEKVNYWEVLGLGTQQWYQTYLGMCTFSELLTKQT